MLKYLDSIAEPFRASLAGWYETHRRSMPWRETTDPYAIWISETMLQQTRVDQALPYFERFVSRFPTVESLAEADLDEVLKHWEGLGYYARARNMHRAAGIIVTQFEGIFPSDYDSMRDLPGIGPYTAAALASIAFGAPRAVLDGNVARVIARLGAYRKDIKSPASRKTLQKAAERLLDRSAPADHNQAMMELGATVCTPLKPDCGSCPAATHCRAQLTGKTHRYPVVSKKPPVPHYDIAVGIVVRADRRMLIARRPENGLLGGLWEFPGGKIETGESAAEACAREIREEMNLHVEVEKPCLRLSHAYTHFKITMQAFWCRHTNGEAQPDRRREFRWVTVEELGKYAFPRANGRLVEHIKREIVTPEAIPASDLSK